MYDFFLINLDPYSSLSFLCTTCFISEITAMETSINLIANANITETTFHWMSHLCQNNMKEHYEKAGWDFTDKHEEISTTELFLLARDQKSNQRLGFLSFQNDKSDDGRPVTYIYEIQIESRATGRGLGKKMMNKLFELIEEDKENLPNLLMCTIQRSNEGSIKFFTKLGFEIDRESPSDETYLILSKRLSQN